MLNEGRLWHVSSFAWFEGWPSELRTEGTISIVREGTSAIMFKWRGLTADAFLAKVAMLTDFFNGECL